MIDYGKNDNKEFNALASKLVKKVLEDKFRLPAASDGTMYSLEDIYTSEPDNDPSVYIRQKLVNGSMNISVYGDVILVNADGKKIKTVEKKVMLGKIPYRSSLGTYLLKGDYSVRTQSRNPSSVYTTLSESGEARSSFQLDKGRSFKYEINKNGYVHIKVGDTTLPLFPLLLSMGATDSEIKDAFISDELYKSNSSYNEAQYYNKLGHAFFYDDPEFTSLNNAEKDARIRDYMEKSTKMDSAATYKFTGINTDKVNKELLLTVLTDLIKVNRKEKQGVDRWDVRNNKLMTPSHLFADRLDKQLPGILNQAAYKLKNKPNDIRKTLTNIITPPMSSTVLTSDLSSLDPQYNLLGAIMTGKTISPVGEGAISSSGLVERKGREFHNSQIGIYDLTFSPQGTNIGISLRSAPGLVVDEDGTPCIKLKSIKTNRVKVYSIERASEFYILEPGEKKEGIVKAIHDCKEVTVPFSKITHEYAENMFSETTQMVPYPTNMQGPRGIMAATQFAQAVPLVNREAPRVVSEDTATGKAASITIGESILTKLGLVAPYNCTIVSIDQNKIKIKSDGGQEKVFNPEPVVPFQYNTGVRIYPVPGLKVGDYLKKGSPLYTTGMHTDSGELAPGVHLRTIYGVDAEGYGVEDGDIISESAAEKLTSEHFYKIEIALNPGETLSYQKIKTLFYHKYDNGELNKIDPETGIIKIGSPVLPGDVLACITKKRTASDSEVLLGKLSRSFSSEIMDVSILWDKLYKGTVEKVILNNGHYIIIVATKEPAKRGTKITGREGNKGVIGLVLPDSEMPIDTATGQPLQLIKSPIGVPSRVNPNQTEEVNLNRTGKKYVHKPFDSNLDVYKLTTEELKKHGMDETGEASVYNPRTGTTNNIGVGELYTLKLFDPEKSVSARGVTGSYDTNLQPVKGGKTGSKATGLMELYGLLGHNAKGLLKEFGTVKSQKNIDFWRNYEMGLVNMPKETPYTFDKFSALMTAGGAKLVRSPEGLSLVPTTDETTNELAGSRKITEGAGFRGARMDEVKGGLFDPYITGGKKGNLWASYNLTEGVVHPLLTDVIRVILNISKKDWPVFQKENSIDIIEDKLKNLNLDDAETLLRNNIKSKSEVSINTKALRFLINFKKTGEKDLSKYILHKVPIAPPNFRPMSELPNGTLVVSDLNYLYSDIINADKLLRETKKEGTPAMVATARGNVNRAYNALVGTEEPASKKLQEKGVKGILTYISGKTSPKEGFVLNKMLKRQMINTGRARILPDPLANMDEVGIPEYNAWKQYEPHLRQKMKSLGFSTEEITKMIRNHDPRARKILDMVLKENYIIVNRAPSIHRLSLLAGRPKIVEGNYITIPTSFEKPLNADYDGDEVTTHAPITAEGKQDAERMMLYNIPFTGYATNDLTTFLDSEAIAGLHVHSVEHREEFETWWKTHLPNIDIPAEVNKKSLKNAVIKIAKQYSGKEYAEKLSELNRKGILWASSDGLTISLKDMKPIDGIPKIIADAKKKLKPDLSNDKKLDILIDTQEKVFETVKKEELSRNSFFGKMLKSGAKSNIVQISAIKGTPTLFINPITKEPELVEGNTSKGYNFSDFIKMNSKARSEMATTKLSVAGPGDLSKQVAFATRQGVITMEDCGTENGILINPATLDFQTDDLIGRILAKDISSTYEKGTPITADNIEDILALKKDFIVRSPRTCGAPAGICAKCYGITDNGEFHKIGEHINITASNSFSVDLMQKGLDAKHSINTAASEKNKKSLFDRTKSLLVGTSDTNNIPIISKIGVVENIKQHEDKSWSVITAEGDTYSLPYPLAPNVKIGDTLHIGQIISDEGSINSKDAANKLGLGHGRRLFSEILHDDILASSGITPHTRNIELVSRELYKYVKFNREYEGNFEGDVISITEAMPIINKLSVEIPVKDLKEGMLLGGDYLEWMPLDVVTQEVLKKLKDASIDKVKVMTDKKLFSPSVKGIASIPLMHGKDWFESMGFRFLKRNIDQALTSGTVQKVDPLLSPLSAYMTNSF